MAAVTIKDIAKALSLSTSTVSRALRNSFEINPETKKLVTDYAEKVNYVPNPIALSLKDKGSKSIGVIVPEIANNFFSQTINGIESVAYNRGYNVVITQSYESSKRELLHTHHLISRRVDGLLVSLAAETEDYSHFMELSDAGTPIVFFDRVPLETTCNRISTDNFGGSYRATKLLIENGAKRPAHISTATTLYTMRERLEGYKAALVEHNYPIIPEHICFYTGGGKDKEENEAIVKRLMGLPEPPDAIFTAGDRITIGCLSALKQLHIAIPDQVQVLGFTNLMVSDLFAPPLTTVVQPALEMGETAAEWLISLIENPKKKMIFDSKILESDIVVRESTIVKEVRV